MGFSKKLFILPVELQFTSLLVLKKATYPKITDLSSAVGHQNIEENLIIAPKVAVFILVGHNGTITYDVRCGPLLSGL